MSHLNATDLLSGGRDAVRQTAIELQKEEAKRIGERLRWVRELIDATPTQLAADLGVDSSSVRHIENGIRLPSIHMLMTLCHVLRISPQYLLWGSLEGVEPELAARLKSAHPQLNWPSAQPAHDNTHSSRPSSGARPRTRARYSSAAAG
jgi:transcriptional regulator with XRE-family HTH domain